MANIFNTIEVPNAAKTRSKFDLSHILKGDFNVGILYPVLCEEVLPGDVWRGNTANFLRIFPLQAPIYAEMDVFIHYFYVPYRIIWENFPKYIRGQEGYTDSDRWPKILFDDKPGINAKGTLADYLGLPVGQPHEAISISALPFRAYQYIYNEYYRDENIIPEIIFSKGDKLNVDEEGNPIPPLVALQELCTLRNRAYSKDLYTSALPFAQKGESVEIPTGSGTIQFKPGSLSRFVDAEGNPIEGDFDIGRLSINNQGVLVYKASTQPGQAEPGAIDVSTNLQIVNSGGIFTVEDLRFLTSYQQFLELDARSGTRYNEFLKAHWDVNISDKTIQRPQYLGGGVSPLKISEVLQQSQTTNDSALGDYAGHGIVVGNQATFRCYCEEHGLIMAIMSIRPKPDYFQGLRRMWTKFDRLELGLPAFAHLGEEAIENKELFFGEDSDKNNKTFGYAPRYYEYKYIPNRLVGNFRDLLRYFTVARKFSDYPDLNKDFIEVKPQDVNNIFALDVTQVPGSYQFAGFVSHNLEVLRKLPKYAVPKLI